MIQNMEKLVQQNPDNVDAYFNWGLALLRLAEYEKALMKFLKVIEIHPEDAEAYMQLGIIYFNQENYSNSIDAFENAEIFDSSNANAKIYYNWGTALLKSSKHEEAITKLETAINLKLDYANAYHSLALASTYLKKFEKAEIQVKQALKIQPENELFLRTAQIISDNS